MESRNFGSSSNYSTHLPLFTLRAVNPPRTVTSFSMAYSFSSYTVSRAMVLKSVLQPLPFTLNCTEL